MIKRTLYFGNPAYLNLRNGQLVLHLPEVAGNDTLSEAFKREAERIVPVEDIGVVVLDVEIGGERRPLMIAAGQTTASLYRCFSGESRKLDYPKIK